MSFNVEDFDFNLPEKLIAQQPVRPRDHARLLVYSRKTGEITDDYFFNVNKYLPVNSTLVLNNSKVDKCRLRIGSTEIFVTKTINPNVVEALVRPGKKFKSSTAIKIENINFKTISVNSEGLRIIQLDRSIDDKSLDKYRLTPLPPYIKQNETLADEYQTIYAKPPGSKAAPTAGLHFTHQLLTRLKKSHNICEITLHVGLGTFAPLRPENIAKVKLHKEWFSIDTRTANKLNDAKHITSVGTTTVRTLESAKTPFCKQSSHTDIFITPGYKFKTVDSLITNFHLPKSSLIMLVAAFIGSAQETLMIYNYAINQKYRFYSFGDAMLIL